MFNHILANKLVNQFHILKRIASDVFSEHFFSALVNQLWASGPIIAPIWAPGSCTSEEQTLQEFRGFDIGEGRELAEYSTEYPAIFVQLAAYLLLFRPPVCSFLCSTILPRLANCTWTALALMGLKLDLHLKKGYGGKLLVDTRLCVGFMRDKKAQDLRE